MCISTREGVRTVDAGWRKRRLMPLSARSETSRPGSHSRAARDLLLAGAQTVWGWSGLLSLLGDR
jgi:hypothetical protein